MRRKMHIEADSTVLTYSYLRSASMNALDYAKATNEGALFNCMTAIVFSAFCIEAYLNHIGQQRISYWLTIERGLNPREKLLVLAETIGYAPDFTRRPFQTFIDIFRFRDSLAHGKTERLKKRFVDKLVEGESPALPKTKWQEACSVETATRYCDDYAWPHCQDHMITKIDKGLSRVKLEARAARSGGPRQASQDQPTCHCSGVTPS